MDLETLFERNGIDLERGEIFEQTPGAMPEGFVFEERVEGMMLGLAIGDALGRPTEGRKPAERRAKHGEVRTYVIGRRAKEAVGLPSDDTQMAFWTLEQLLEDGELDPERLGELFSTREIFGMGQTVSKFRRQFKKKTPWYKSGPASAGNGALMRIAPVVIPHLMRPSPRWWEDAALAAMLTHNDAGSTACCVAFVAMLWDLLAMDEAPEPSWWLERYVEVASQLEGDAVYKPRGGRWEGLFAGPIHEYVAQGMRWVEREQVDTVDACDAFYSGAYLLETMPCVILLLTRYGHDPQEAIVRAVNDTKDNDTIAAIVGAAVGALHGRAALDEAWISGLTGRTMSDDDGRVFELLEQACQRFGASPPSSSP